MLTGKTLLLTGAGRGIGYEIAKCALREGACVVAHVGRTQSKDVLFQSDSVLALTGDLSKPADIKKLWQNALNWKHRIDVLINNAGVYVASPLDPHSAWENGWEQNLAINLRAPANLCRHAIQHFQQSNEGIIINMSSRAAHRGDGEDHMAYSAAKGGLLSLTKGIARNHASTNTVAYAIAPAWVRTQMAEAFIKENGENNITADLPMREITPASDVAETIIFLASGKARHANGCTIDITGADYVR